MTIPVPAATPLDVLSAAFDDTNNWAAETYGYGGQSFTLNYVGLRSHLDEMAARVIAALAPAPAGPTDGEARQIDDAYEQAKWAFHYYPGDASAKLRKAVESALLVLSAPRPARPDAGEAVALLKEPTDEMLDAAVKGTRADISYEDAREIWAAMRKVHPPAASAETARVAELEAAAREYVAANDEVNSAERYNRDPGAEAYERIGAARTALMAALGAQEVQS